MKVTYIHHSSFLAETESACLLFDYFQGPLPAIPENKPLYVFASHHHPDHYSSVIFGLAARHADIRFILAFDIRGKAIPEEFQSRTVFMNPGDVYKENGLTVEAFRSTDEGVAFWCRTDGLDIYHAGDLNHWYWNEEDEQWNRDMTEAYRAEIRKMKGRTADAAFLPLDPRLEEWFYLGIDDFMKEADARHIFPMHFWGQYDVAKRLKEHECSAGYRDRIVEIEAEGQTFEL